MCLLYHTRLQMTTWDPWKHANNVSVETYLRQRNQKMTWKLVYLSQTRLIAVFPLHSLHIGLEPKLLSVKIDSTLLPAGVSPNYVQW